jgi:hypothetical protein
MSPGSSQWVNRRQFSARRWCEQLQGLFKGIAEVVSQLLAGLTLGVDAGDFFDPTDPPRTVLLDNGRIARCHEEPHRSIQNAILQPVYDDSD